MKLWVDTVINELLPMMNNAEMHTTKIGREWSSYMRNWSYLTRKFWGFITTVYYELPYHVLGLENAVPHVAGQRTFVLGGPAHRSSQHTYWTIDWFPLLKHIRPYLAWRLYNQLHINEPSASIPVLSRCPASSPQTDILVFHWLRNRTCMDLIYHRKGHDDLQLAWFSSDCKPHSSNLRTEPFLCRRGPWLDHSVRLTLNIRSYTVTVGASRICRRGTERSMRGLSWWLTTMRYIKSSSSNCQATDASVTFLICSLCKFEYIWYHLLSRIGERDGNDPDRYIKTTLSLSALGQVHFSHLLTEDRKCLSQPPYRSLKPTHQFNFGER